MQKKRRVLGANEKNDVLQTSTTVITKCFAFVASKFCNKYKYLTFKQLRRNIFFCIGK